MSIRSKVLEVVFFNVIKWCIVIIFLGIVGYLIMPKYDLIDEHKLFNKVTGKIEKKEVVKK